MVPARDREEVLFREALQRPKGPERQAFIDQACAGEPVLRARLGALVQAHENPVPFLEGATIALAPDEGPGTLIGRYKILEKIAEGGFGIVYVAEQREPVKRRVALKIIKLGMDTRQVVARFEAERQALALMDHPNIAKVFDAGATDTGRPYFVMELVKGVPITHYFEQEKTELTERLKLFIQICHAIQHAHQKGIIHRDIKPSNILVTLHDGVPVPKVIDFGIAKATQQELTEKTVYTQFQQFIGTPAYMSPEQAEMSGLDIDTRSDIYSLGVLLYELLTGSTPFDTQELLKSGLDEMRKIIREREPVRPSTRLRQTASLKPPRVQLSTLYSQLSTDLDWIVMKCLEKDRRRRYETANGIAQDIERHLQYEPITARPPSTVYRVQKFVRRNKVMVSAAALIAGVLVLGIVGSTWQAVRATRAEREQARARQTAVAARQVAEQESARAREAAERLRWTAYAAEMRAAQIALDESKPGHCRELLMKYLPQPGQVDVRGFEWRYLWAETRSDSTKEFRHDTPVCQAILFPDGATLVTQCLDGSIRVWDTRRNAVLRQLPSVSTSRLGPKIACSPDGALLSLCMSNEVLVLETKSWTPRRRLPAAGEAAFSADSNELVLSDPDQLTFCDLKTGACLSASRQIRGAPNQHTVFSPDGRLMFLNQRYLGKIEVWDLPHHSPLRILRHDRQCVAMAVSPDSRWLAVGFWEGTLALYALPEFKLVLTQKAHGGIVSGVVFSPDSHLLATGGGDQLIKLWEVPNSASGLSELSLSDTFKGHADAVWDLAFSLDGTQLISASKDETARLWPVLKQGRHPVLFSHDSRDENVGVYGSENGFALLSSRHGMFWSWRPGGMVQGRDFRTGVATPLSPSPLEPTNTWVPEEGIRYLAGDGVLYGCATNGEMTAWDLATGQSRVLLGHPPSPCIAGVVTNQGHLFVLVRNLATRQTEAWLAGSSQPCTEPWTRALADTYNTCPCTQSPDGKLVASGATDFSVMVTTLDDPPSVRKLIGHKSNMFSVAFSSDSRWLASASWDITVRVWDLTAGGRCVRTLRTGAAVVQFTPDGRTLVTAANDRVRFWNLQTGQEVLALSGRPIVPWPALSSWVVPPDSDDGLLTSSLDGKGRFTPVPSLRDIDLEIRQEFGPLREASGQSQNPGAVMRSRSGAQ